MRVWIWTACLLLACKGKDVDTADACACEVGELCVENRDEADASATFTTCEAVPGECGTAPNCDDNTCLADLFGLCAVGFEGSACSEDESPALICYAEAP